MLSSTPSMTTVLYFEAKYEIFALIGLNITHDCFGYYALYFNVVRLKKYAAKLEKPKHPNSIS